MSSVVRRFAVTVLIAAIFFGWRARTAQDVAVAQTRKPIMVTRIYTGADGLSHGEEVELKTAGAGGATEMFKATGIQFSSRAPGPASDWHTGPMRQYVITLSGRGELELGDGKKVEIGPGQIDLIEDTTGKGHTTRNIGPDDRIVVTIPLADQNPGVQAR